MAKRHQRVSLYTILAVGEGGSDAVFLKYLKKLYVTRQCGTTTTVKNAYGRGPKHVIEFTVRQANNASYDRVIAFLDTDLIWTADVSELARDNNIQMIGSEPCFEGLLLNILEKNVPGNSRDCKRRLSVELNGSSLTDQATFERYFDFDILEHRRQDIDMLDQLINQIKK